MYERMLEKTRKPTLEEFCDYCGSRKELFLQLRSFLLACPNMQEELRFPYGKQYGWGMKYAEKRKHMCDIFAEKDAITVMMRLADEEFFRIYEQLLPISQDYIDHRYPCGAGGWIHYRVLNEEQRKDVEKLLTIKRKG